jgi:hypothetical protein
VIEEEEMASPHTTPAVRRQNPETTRLLQLVWVRTAIPMVIMLFGGLTLAGFMEPLSPFAPAHVIAHIYAIHTNRIRFGLAISFLSIIFMFSFGSSVIAQARRIEGAAPVLSYTQLAGLASGTLIFILPWCFWEVAAFRPARDASQIQLLNDVGWIIFTFSFMAFSAWNWALGAAILTDRREKPVFPRWAGYYNIFVGISFMPDICVVFFKTGPFDWRGLIPYWGPFVIYGIWILVMMVLTGRAINQEAAEAKEELAWTASGTTANVPEPVLAHN